MQARHNQLAMRAFANNQAAPDPRVNPAYLRGDAGVGGVVLLSSAAPRICRRKRRESLEGLAFRHGSHRIGAYEVSPLGGVRPPTPPPLGERALPRGLFLLPTLPHLIGRHLTFKNSTAPAVKREV